MDTGLPLSQIAMSVMDLKNTYAWYQQVFGFVPAGGTHLFRGPIASRIQGLQRAASTCWWLVDQQSQFQLEMFQFKSPQVRPLPKNWRPCDIGYSMISLWVADFDECLVRLELVGSSIEAEPMGKVGARRVCVKDPEGVLLELMEHDPRAGVLRGRPSSDVPVAVRSVTLSVENLEQSKRFFNGVLGLKEVGTKVEETFSLHGPEHEALWGLEGATRKQVLLWADDILIELVEYVDPVGEVRAEGYRISDQGLLNIAFGFRSRREFSRVYRRCIESGVLGNCRPLHLGAWSVVYVNDQQGFSVELLMVKPWYERFMGFKAKPRWHRSNMLDVESRAEEKAHE
jgi:catechol 2,3-dioxygenase-like lactoylglutathione lyase family enzyme